MENLWLVLILISLIYSNTLFTYILFFSKNLKDSFSNKILSFLPQLTRVNVIIEKLIPFFERFYLKNDIYDNNQTFNNEGEVYNDYKIRNVIPELKPLNIDLDQNNQMENDIQDTLYKLSNEVFNSPINFKPRISLKKSIDTVCSAVIQNQTRNRRKTKNK